MNVTKTERETVVQKLSGGEENLSNTKFINF